MGWCERALTLRVCVRDGGQGEVHGGEAAAGSNGATGMAPWQGSDRGLEGRRLSRTTAGTELWQGLAE
jgi:hypothetical protein